MWDGAFASTTVFWWPFSGDWGDVTVPSLDRPVLGVVMELAGAAMLWWVWRRFRLAEPARRQQFLQHGLLSDH